jgi:hypothetical protein
MDHAPIANCFPLVEIAHWSADDVNRVLELRANGLFSKHEELIWGSHQEYVRLLHSCANRKLASPLPGAAQRIRAEWDGSEEQYVFQYRVHPSALA